MNEMKILVVDDDPAILKLITKVLNKWGFPVTTASDGLQALELFKRDSYPIVLTDVMMPQLNGIELLKEIRKLNPLTFVITMTAHGNENLAITALREGAANYIKKPFALDHIKDVVTRIARTIKQQLRTSPDRSSVVQEWMVLEIKNDLDKIFGVVNQALSCASNIVKVEELSGLSIGLYEIILNAMEHGNLEINFDEKTRLIETNTYLDAITERKCYAAFKSRTVKVISHINRTRIKVVVKDNGPGFDWRSKIGELEEMDPMELLNHGRGILLARINFDEIRYNDAGNVVTLIKRATTCPET
ncbi:MAG: response regulator [Deltaproteobacteria bacterium]|nr:response regulator [Deltaproteobacteria bacterium]